MRDQSYDEQDGAYEMPAYVKGSATSENAARSLGAARIGKLAAILALFEAGGTYTRDEVVVKLGELYQSVLPRLAELCRAGCLVETGETRMTGGGHQPAEVLRWVPGMSIAVFKSWMKGYRVCVARYHSWEKDFLAAGEKYKDHPTSENRDALATSAQMRPTKPEDHPPAQPPTERSLEATAKPQSPPVSPVDDGDEIDEDLARAMAGGW